MGGEVPNPFASGDNRQQELNGVGKGEGDTQFEALIRSPSSEFSGGPTAVKSPRAEEFPGLMSSFRGVRCCGAVGAAKATRVCQDAGEVLNPFASGDNRQQELNGV